jgi:YNFM family putative membrane transporter
MRAQHAKAQASSLYLFAYYLGSSVVGSLGGVFWNVGGWSGVIAMTGTVVLPALVNAIWLSRTSSQRQPLNTAS